MRCFQLSPPRPSAAVVSQRNDRKMKFAASAKTQAHQAPIEAGAGSLTTGKLNAVRAAFKAGVRPSAIARQFGISQSDVRKALATEGRDQKSRR